MDINHMPVDIINEISAFLTPYQEVNLYRTTAPIYRKFKYRIKQYKQELLLQMAKLVEAIGRLPDSLTFYLSKKHSFGSVSFNLWSRGDVYLLRNLDGGKDNIYNAPVLHAKLMAAIFRGEVYIEVSSFYRNMRMPFQVNYPYLDLPAEKPKPKRNKYHDPIKQSYINMRHNKKVYLPHY